MRAEPEAEPEGARPAGLRFPEVALTQEPGRAGGRELGWGAERDLGAVGVRVGEVSAQTPGTRGGDGGAGMGGGRITEGGRTA